MRKLDYRSIAILIVALLVLSGCQAPIEGNLSTTQNICEGGTATTLVYETKPNPRIVGKGHLQAEGWGRTPSKIIFGQTVEFHAEQQKSFIVNLDTPLILGQWVGGTRTQDFWRLWVRSSDSSAPYTTTFDKTLEIAGKNVRDNNDYCLDGNGTIFSRR